MSSRRRFRRFSQRRRRKKTSGRRRMMCGAPESPVLNWGKWKRRKDYCLSWRQSAGVAGHC